MLDDARPPIPRPAERSPLAHVRFWDRIACKYAADPVADVAGYECTLQKVAALLTRDDEVLEVGCGTGTTALRLAPHARLTCATDASSRMIAIARQKLATQPVPGLVFDVADLTAWPFRAPTWNAVLAFNVLHLVPDLDAALVALRSSLRPGGLLISKTPCLAEMNPLVPRVLVPLMRAIGKAPPVLSLDAAQLRHALERQGFVVERLERHGTRGRDARPFIVARKCADP